MSQYMHLLTNSGIGFPTDLWVPATPQAKPQTGDQAALGLSKTLNDFEISLEGYYRTMQHVITYEEGASYLSKGESWQDKIAAGEGRSYGAELFVQKKVGKWSGWLGYTLSWSNRKFEKLNFGKPFPYRFDRRHDVNLTINFTPRKGFTTSATWVYATGEALTLPNGTYASYQEYRNIKYFQERNSFRMNPYHRLDLSAGWTKQKSWGTRTWTISVYNAYNHQNPYFIEAQPTVSNQQFVQHSLFPIIPTVTYSITF